jgi:hypothetical protein
MLILLALISSNTLSRNTFHSCFASFFALDNIFLALSTFPAYLYLSEGFLLRGEGEEELLVGRRNC